MCRVWNGRTQKGTLPDSIVRAHTYYTLYIRSDAPIVRVRKAAFRCPCKVNLKEETTRKEGKQKDEKTARMGHKGQPKRADTKNQQWTRLPTALH